MQDALATPKTTALLIENELRAVGTFSQLPCDAVGRVTLAGQRVRDMRQTRRKGEV